LEACELHNEAQEKNQLSVLVNTLMFLCVPYSAWNMSELLSASQEGLYSMKFFKGLGLNIQTVV
jgi:hypothetical protein